MRAGEYLNGGLSFPGEDQLKGEGLKIKFGNAHSGPCSYKT